MSPPILVTGATGTIGGAVADELAALGAGYRVSSRSSEVVDRFRSRGHDAVRVDFADPSSLAEALDGIEVLFLVSGQHPDQASHQGNVVRAASGLGVEDVVKISGGTYLTTEKSGSWVGRAHWQTEREIAGSGLGHVFLRPNYFMQNLLHLAGPVAGGILPVPIADGRRLAMVDSRDIAAVAARILVDPAPHRGRAYELTGPQAIDFAAVAERMTAILGHPVEHVTPSIETAVAALRDKGAPPWLQRHVSETTAVFASDPAVAAVSEDVERITGRPPRSIDDFLRDHADAFLIDPQPKEVA